MIADNIPTTEKSLEERGLPSDSYYEIVFVDDSTASEKNTNWSDFSIKKNIQCFGQELSFFVCRFPFKSINIFLNNLGAMFKDIPQGYEVCQFIRSERLLATGVDKETIVGRGIGLIKDGSMVEELFINALENKVQGIRR